MSSPAPPFYDAERVVTIDCGGFPHDETTNEVRTHMPIYGYRCTNCGHELEVLQSMRDAPLTVCEACGGPLQKKLYPVGVQFKGSGFYSTDYKRSAQKAADGKSETKSDGKPDGKAGAASSSSTNGGKAESSGSGEKASSKAAES